MLHINMHGYFCHIPEIPTSLRGMNEKFLIFALNETFFTKAIENVQLEDDPVLARRDREGQWGGGVLVFVLDQYFHRVTLVEQFTSTETIWAIVHPDRGPDLVCC